MYIYMGAVVTTVRIDEDLLREAKRYRIKLSKVLEEGLRKVLAEIKKKRAEEAAKEVANKLKGVDIEAFVEIVREMREKA